LQLFSTSTELGEAYDSAGIKFSSFYDKQLGGLRGGASVPLLNITKDKVIPNKFKDTDRVIDFKMKSLDIIVAAFEDRARRSITGRLRNPNIDAQLSELGRQLEAFRIEGRQEGPPILSGENLTIEQFRELRRQRLQQGR